MNLLLLEDGDLDLASGSGGRPAARAVVRGERLLHVRKVLRAKVGDSLEVGRLGGGIGRGRIVELNRERVVVELGPLDEEPPRPLPVTLVLALPRPKFVGRILQSATAMGVKRILLVHTARVEKSYWHSSVMRPEALPDLVRCHDDLLVADAAGAEPRPLGVRGRTALLVGPEGGFLDREIASFAHAGARLVSLGPRALRVEHAVVALLSRLGT